MCKKDHPFRMTQDALLMYIITLHNDPTRKDSEATRDAIAKELAGLEVIGYRGECSTYTPSQSNLQRIIEVALMSKRVHTAWLALVRHGRNATPFRMSYVPDLYKAWNLDGKREGKHFRAEWQRMKTDPPVTIRVRKSERAKILAILKGKTRVAA